MRWWAPGRVNLIGEHTDYNDGFALPFAIPLGVTATVEARDDGQLRISSAQEPDTLELPMTKLAPGAVEGWAAYPAGAVWALLTRAGRLGAGAAPVSAGAAPAGAGAGGSAPGLEVHVDGQVPLGAGLSSSAAIVCSTAAAADDLLGLGLERSELITLTRRAENDFVGAPTGGMDQTASLLCRSGHVLLLDTRTMTTRQVPFDPDAAGLAVLVTDTRIRHRHADGAYADRHDACARAAAALGVPALRDLAAADLPAALERLGDDDAAQRAVRHVVTENERVLRTVELLDAGRPAEIGPLLDASHQSLRVDFRVSTPEVDLAVETAKAAGALGSRITGGGFGGCTITLCRAGDIEGVQTAVSDAYAERGYEAPRFLVVTPAGAAHPVP
ncbi:MAG TPA: galactokinase [Acidimicrobiales bacterium]|nr:galactokinase [Acidimicrobiales bacterium]